MKKKYLNLSISCTILAIVLSNSISTKAQSDNPDKAPHFEAISDVDLSFFITNPKLPWSADPFLREPGYKQMTDAGEPIYNLGGIIYSKNTPLAIVNGKTVKEGDKVGERSVSSIGENYITLKKKNSEIEVSLPPLIDEQDQEESENQDE